ncbi:Sec-independent protein translocase subunit TatA/TatB [Myroides odoratimimus]|uniref:Sec-independent protein translocase subunit TatA/TatB n=1 Tax=Myroides odoratimimus TaxID=76832 RepID=UPI00046AB215|nr:twin-arginine translocase TatA/TatE family subunit [Myroides odoratimimus]MCA4806108.1 twin-arginine translocase TatA/TatE family subunit [Myroides odoratimimus]MCO7723172.1 twin-arginine translocase TatA/TatE family subunit [Myroides odoratimimus]MDM1095106.1 twin-arginine translocase TatA/TatE family subunit [Myroides odoratimimus]MDM1441970.1 twin-arginine translocase TatA/TatE family subunit [Myroides odoratimimus]MEC4075538.1 twin-arginine translocase TatA/TatE family subunit [Myroides
MFGIGGGELFFIIIIILMLFGSDKVPEMARTFGKFMAQLKNATNDIKHEINKSAEESGIKKDITETFDIDINPMKDIQNEVEKQKEDIENITGPIKRQL